MKFTVWPLIFAFVASVAEAQTGSTGGNIQQTLAKVAGTESLVTVVLKGNQMKDANLRVQKVFADHFRAVDETGIPIMYQFDSIAEVQVQSGAVEKKVFTPPTEVGLSSEEQSLLDAARDKALQIFKEKSDDQDLKIRMAAFLAVNGDASAVEYLTKLGAANDVDTQLRAAHGLYLAGQPVPKESIQNGLKSGNRGLRATAASLAGCTGQKDPILNTMLHDRIAELAAPAARALARLGDRTIVPDLLVMLDATNAERNDAAVFGLTTLGGPDIIEQMKALLAQPAATDPYKARAARILYDLGDPAGQEYFQTALRSSNSQSLSAALLLAEKGEWNAVEYLNGRLQRREDPSECNLIARARMAAALVKGGDLSATATLQELLQGDNPLVVGTVYNIIAESGDRRFLPILKPYIDSANLKISANACFAAGALAKGEFRDRLAQVLRDDEYKDPCLR